MANSYYQRKATIDAINAKKPEALKRDAHTDYTSGCFFVTLNICEHKPLLGTITSQINHQKHQANDVAIRLSQLGELVLLFVGISTLRIGLQNASFKESVKTHS